MFSNATINATVRAQAQLVLVPGHFLAQPRRKHSPQIKLKVVMRKQLCLVCLVLKNYAYAGWRLGVVVSVVGRINEVNQHRARLVHDG